MNTYDGSKELKITKTDDDYDEEGNEYIIILKRNSPSRRYYLKNGDTKHLYLSDEELYALAK